MRHLSIVIAGAALALVNVLPSSAQTNPWTVLTRFPAYVTMQTYHSPSIANVMGKSYVFYEVYVLNAYGADIDVTQLAVNAGEKTAASFSGPALAALMRPLGRQNAAPSRTIAAAETAVLYVAVTFAGAHDVPQSLEDTLTFRVPQAGGHVFTVKQAALRINSRPPVLIEPPLRGTGWFAGEGPSNDSGHRRTIFFLNGRPYLGQRFAIDWVEGKIDSAGHLTFFHGDPKKNEDWYCWNQPLYAVADGVVVAERTDLPENVPLESPAVSITQQTIGGNFVVLDIGYGRYAFYAHLRPHSATVKVGQHVKVGQVIGRLGNSGNSTAPHLHFHITDAPEFLFAEGEPYVFATMRAATSTYNDEKPEEGATLSSPFQTYHASMPGNGAVLDFTVLPPGN